MNAARAIGTGEAFDPGAVVVRLPRPGRLSEPLEGGHAKADKALAALGLETVGDLLERHLPRERRAATGIGGLVEGEPSTIVVEVRSIRQVQTRSRKIRGFTEATVGDGAHTVKARFFNQPWLAGRYPKGTRLVLEGKLSPRGGFSVTQHAVTDQAVGGEAAEGAAVARYAASEGITSTELAALAVAHREAIHDVVESLPAALRLEEGLAGRRDALSAMHFGGGDAEVARARLAFDELLLGQLLFARRRARHAALCALALGDAPTMTREWRFGTLPFEPTGDQDRAMDAVSADLARERPMQRLLMGEVGSGKTVVALHAMLRAVEHGCQAALMAPTEVLAEQHFATLQALLPHGFVSVALLTGSTPAGRRADLLGKLASGELHLVVGTHALIEEPVVFDRLAVAVVDEQHRFGVRQRAALDRKGPGDAVPHVLHMTATPIPRTLRLLDYGDLDATELKELPKGRQPIVTHVASSEAERERAYARIREEVAAGRQAFVVCPLVNDSEAVEARSATAEFERLRTGPLRGLRLALLHGQMRPREKAEAMGTFAGGGADVLVATTVIEVGVDVPNATIMVVEDAERYGISQLHQLRGRVGRGGHASVCLLFGPKGSRRLQALREHTDGFALARIDLELRREGELGGTRQSGVGQFDVAVLPDDEPLLARAGLVAERLLAEDPDLVEPEHEGLAAALRNAYGAQELEPIPA